MSRTVTFDYRAKCRLNPDWAADEIARVRAERDRLRASLDAAVAVVEAAKSYLRYDTAMGALRDAVEDYDAARAKGGG